MSDASRPARRVILRDLIIFHVKLWLDGLKDVVLAPLSLVCALIDILFFTGEKSLFYQVLRLGERFDLWLNLYGAAKDAGDDPDGLFGVSRAGDSTFVGQLEQLVQGPFAPDDPLLGEREDLRDQSHDQDDIWEASEAGWEDIDAEWDIDAAWDDLNTEGDGQSDRHSSTPAPPPKPRPRSGT